MQIRSYLEKIPNLSGWVELRHMVCHGSVVTLNFGVCIRWQYIEIHQVWVSGKQHVRTEWNIFWNPKRRQYSAATGLLNFVWQWKPNFGVEGRGEAVHFLAAIESFIWNPYLSSRHSLGTAVRVLAADSIFCLLMHCILKPGNQPSTLTVKGEHLEWKM